MLALLFSLPVRCAGRRGAQHLGHREFVGAVLAGVLFAGDMLLWTLAIFDMGADISTVIVNVQVIVAPLLALVIDREPVMRLFLATLPVKALGVLLAGGGLTHGAGSTHTVDGTVEAVLAAVGYSGFCLFCAAPAKPHPSGRLIHRR